MHVYGTTLAAFLFAAGLLATLGHAGPAFAQGAALDSLEKLDPAAAKADDVAAAMTRHDPATLPPAQREQWVGEVATTIDRLPPHEFPKLFQRAMQDPVLRERFHALGPDQQHKLGLLLSEEQFARMVVELSAPMVDFCRRLPTPVRRHVVRQVHRLSKEHAAARGQEMTKENFAHWQKATTPSRSPQASTMKRLRACGSQSDILPMNRKGSVFFSRETTWISSSVPRR